jgi:protein-tyrosine phosphatase
MIPLVDLHCHLLAGMDDGPRTPEDALAMCRIAYTEGIRMACATAHQNETWSEVTPDGIRSAAQQLADRLREANLPLTVFPCAEVMVSPDLESSWRERRILSVADRGQYLLLEMPHGLCVDLRATARRLVKAGARPILAHPERCAELLEDAGRIEGLLEAGCLVQVSTRSITEPANRGHERELKSWFQRGIVHFLGSDGHSPRRRAPVMAEAYHRVVRWIGPAAADRVCGTNGLAVLQGIPLRVPPPKPRARRWLARIW